MRPTWTSLLAAAACAAMPALAAGPAIAPALTTPPAGGPQQGWFDTAELSYVLTSGNSRANTLGFKNKLVRGWATSWLTFRTEAIRAQTTTVARSAIGTPDAYREVESTAGSLSAESYLVDLAYDAKSSETFYWHAGARWDRNRFAGVLSRYAAELGVGTIWSASDAFKFRTGYALTLTRREDVVEVPGRENSFAGLRVSSELTAKIGPNAAYTNTTTFDGNLRASSDWRGNTVSGITVAINKKLALKAACEWLYSNRPAFTSVPLFDEAGVPAGTTVLVPLDRLDTTVTTSLVINL